MSIHEVAGIHEGDILAGKYRVDRLLGVGGMGAVVAAHHIQLDDRVAIKFLLPEVRENAEAVARFLREARAAVKIKSQHVARVTDVGTLENGLPYMIMEYLEGSDLDRWLVEKGPLPIGQACELVLQACEAIAEAHALGIVHRDLKPANLFAIRRPDGMLSVKVLDFGISKMPQSTTGAGLTRTAMMMGSPLYMSPEQIESTRDVDQRTDIWALGVILYELVTGKVPFDGSAMAELAMHIITQPPVPLRDRCAHAPPGFEPVILRCLEKDPRRRYQSVGELANALVPFAPTRAQRSASVIAGVLGPASPPPPAALQPAAAAEPQVSAVHVLGRSTIGGGTRSARGLWIAGLVALAVLGLVGWLRLRAQPDAGEAPGKALAEAAAGSGEPAPPLAATSERSMGQSGAITAPAAAGNSALAQPGPSRDTATRPRDAVDASARSARPRPATEPSTVDKKAPVPERPTRSSPGPVVREPRAVPVAPVPAEGKKSASPWGGRL